MSKSAKKAADQAEREKVHKRYSNRREPDVIYPAKKQVDFYDADVHQRVAVYVRVSTDNLGQETSYELQKNYRFQGSSVQIRFENFSDNFRFFSGDDRSTIAHCVSVWDIPRLFHDCLLYAFPES